jgi:hypothetical protein
MSFCKSLWKMRQGRNIMGSQVVTPAQPLVDWWGNEIKEGIDFSYGVIR